MAFRNLLSEIDDWRPNINGLDFESLDGLETGKMEEPFLEKEGFSALLELNGDKALGLD